MITDKEIADVATDPAIRAMAIEITNAKMGRILGNELHEVAEDALSDSINGLLQARKKGTTSFSAASGVEYEDIREHPVAKYLYVAVESYCNTRLERWSILNSKGERGSRVRQVFYSKRPDGSDFWEKHIDSDHDYDQVDSERVDKLLSERGVSEDDIMLLKLSLSGWSYVDLANKYGGTPDKYRVRVGRVLKKANIDSELL